MGIVDNAAGLASGVLASAKDFLFDEHPPAAFYFKVVIGVNLLSDTSFQDVSGISTTIETEQLVEGGNQYVRNLPTKISHPNLVLKRGIASALSPLVVWCRATMETDFLLPIVPLPVSVHLLNAHKIPIRSWVFVNAYPVKWEVEKFNSEENKVAIETIELSYMYSTRLL